ncbi:hypothetical protein MCOR27_008472 [Pyricularia oryzae]|nr:hypothetical protein MCOR01_009922 [Pyricularia oryzae]KAI6272205.1 hypothetical protein MCOR27_008472 [Pyricularia oryzae]KAI6329403.1 hypothetical protein MCOR30_005628 [Pyricularia oryzae]KAI6338606.1 hypothetical protein MCOR28_007820 [Pyricularia oryzae]KAI6395223.1 hypothetical protein MCOR23_007192 [Pyricularia oryzae]
MQFATPLVQNNYMVSSENDCKAKYVAWRLFRRLAKQGRLSLFGFAEDNWSAGRRDAAAKLPMPGRCRPFRLWCDDFRPANAIFVLDPPWWLPLEVPEMRDDGIDHWASVYDRRMQNGLAAMEDAEKEADYTSMQESNRKITSTGPDQTPPLLPLSYMRESWATGQF